MVPRWLAGRRGARRTASRRWWRWCRRATGRTVSRRHRTSTALHIVTTLTGAALKPEAGAQHGLRCRRAVHHDVAAACRGLRLRDAGLDVGDVPGMPRRWSVRHRSGEDEDRHAVVVVAGPPAGMVEGTWPVITAPVAIISSKTSPSGPASPGR